MFVNFLLGMIALCGCISNTYGMQSVGYSNSQTFSGIDTIIIHNNDGNICVKPSLSNETIVTFNGSPDNADIFRNNGRLTIENKQKSYFSFFNPKVDFCIYSPSSVRNIDISLGGGKVAVETQVQKLAISGGDLDILLKDMKGDMRISGGKCSVRYIGETKTLNENVSFDISSGHLTFTAFLSDAFHSMCNFLRCPALKIKETFLPMVTNNADLTINGSCGSAEISVKKLSEM